MSNLNCVVLQGNLVSDPTPLGEKNNVVRFTIANNTGFGDKTVSTFIDCVAFGKPANIILEHFKKGKQVLVKGKLVQQRWEDKEGQKKSRFEIHLDNFDGFSFVADGKGKNLVDEQQEEQEEEEEQVSKSSKKKLF